MLGHHPAGEHAHGTLKHQTSSHGEEHIETQAERKGTLLGIVVSNAVYSKTVLSDIDRYIRKT